KRCTRAPPSPPRVARRRRAPPALRRLDALHESTRQGPHPALSRRGRERKSLAHRGVHVGAKLAHRLARTAIERRIGVDQVAQLVSWDLQLDGELEDAEEVATSRTHGGGSYQHPAVGVLD